MANKSTKWCFAWLEPQRAGGQAKAVGLKSALWPDGTVITVSFMDGSAKLHKRVQDVAAEWIAPGLANLTLSFQKKPGRIRISFLQRGSWSAIGTTCRNIGTAKPTMNFGWLDSETPADELRRVVLHEFGHALGLIHEHQNPKGGIDWNRENVIADLSGAPHFWTKQQIETNIFKRFKKSEVNGTKLDKKSIMLYPIPERWTNDGFSSRLNASLSALDCKLISQLYPAD